MVGFQEYPDNYVLFTGQQTKELNVVLSIDGLPYSFATQNSYTRVRYNDPGIYYGQEGLVYGALRGRDDIKPYLMFESGLTLSQRLEPEQGRASISQLTFSLIDKDGFVSRVISPGGGLLDEILGRAIVVRIGYKGISYPEDYMIVFRGIITQVQIVAGRVVITTGDANQKRRSAIFRVAKTSLNTPINSSTLSIPLTGIQAPNIYDLLVNEGGAPGSWSCKPYLRIEDEVIPYGYGAISGNTITALARGGALARDTLAVSHDAGTEVTNGLELNGHPITLALKIMLSGWGGAPWKTGVASGALGTVVDPLIDPATNAICLPMGDDAVTDYGLTVGDRIQVTGSGAGNDGTYTITAIADSEGFPNRLIYISASLALENPSPATLSFYSQFDVLPINAGLQLTPNDVDVKTHLKYRDTIFGGQENYVSIYITSQQTGKEFIERELYLPIGAYSLTRYGRLSMGYTKPPVAEDKLIVLDATNVTNPQNIVMTRGLNNRKFYNQIQYQYDATDDGSYQQVLRSIDTDSLNKIGIMQLLPISSSGVKAQYGGGVLASRVCSRMLTRFKKAAFDIQLSTFWNPGTFIEAGDGIVLKDGGFLKLTDFDTGERDLGTKVFEVTDRSLDIKTGQVKLTLTSGLGNLLSARYGVISPSSLISSAGTTAQNLKLKPSFGNTINEGRKWSQLAGILVTVHNSDYTLSETKTLVGVSGSDPNTIILSAPLSFLPGENYIVDVAAYGSGSDPDYNRTAKAIYGFVAPTLSVLAGLSNTSFTVSLLDYAKLTLGAVIQVRNSDYSILSPEVTVTGLVGPNTVVVGESLGFTPAAGEKVEIVGFLDGGGAYRLM